MTYDPLFSPFRGVLLDAYGVFWGGGIGVLPGAEETMKALCSSGKIVGILSNTSQRGAKEILKFARHGLHQGTHYHFILTSGDITHALFTKRDLPFPVKHNAYWMLGTPHPQFCSLTHLFDDTPFKEVSDLAHADFILPAIPHLNGEDQTDPDLFREQMVDLVRHSGLPLVCVNPDTFAHEGTPPRPVVRQGSLAAMYEEAGGKVIYIGKPSPVAFSAALDQFRTLGIHSPNQIIMVGDTPETDIRGAKASHMTSALVTKIGIFADRYPALALNEALSKLPPSDQPDFTLPCFPYGL